MVRPPRGEIASDAACLSDDLERASPGAQQDRLSGENQRPNGPRNGSKERIAGTRSGPGDCKRLGLQDFQRAGDGTRTRDVQLGKLAFYQLNYARTLLTSTSPKLLVRLLGGKRFALE